MSPRAAARLEDFGFSNVYDYAAGKLDWLAHGLPSEGSQADVPTAKDAMRSGVPTCHPGERMDEARKLSEGRRNSCVIVDRQGVVLGRLRRDAYDAPDGTPVEERMEPGPVTFRPDVPLEELVGRMQKRKVGSVLITTSDGVLVGVLFRSRGERVLHERLHG